MALDGWTDAVIKFLSQHAGVSGVRFTKHDGCTQAAIAQWEQRNAPYRLPDAYKSFLQISDGFTLTWDVTLQGERFPLGSMHLNGLADITRIPMLAVAEDDDDTEDTMRVHNIKAPVRMPAAAFDLDCTCASGRVALVFSSAAEPPRVWFQELSSSWSFVARGFSDYFRILIMHLGLPNWQYTFSAVGLDPISRQFFNFLTPERLAIDMENSTMHKTTKKERKASKGGGGGSRAAAAAAAAGSASAKLKKEAAAPRKSTKPTVGVAPSRNALASRVASARKSFRDVGAVEGTGFINRPASAGRARR